MEIRGFLQDGKLDYTTDLFTIDNDKYFLLIDGSEDEEYYSKIISSYEKQGKEFINDLKDYISLYFYDKKKDKLFLINDRIGAKKIYYYVDNNKIYFGNDLRILGIDNLAVNTSILSMYFRYHYIPEPYTIYEDVFKVKHGNYIIKKGNKIYKKEYWNPISAFNSRKINNSFNLEEGLSNMLEKKIKELSDNKDNICVYVSGGVDSNVVASLFNKVSKNKITILSIGYDCKKYDETGTSKKTSEYLGANHRVISLKTSNALEYVNKIADYYCEPFGDASAIATIQLNEFAKKNNIKYALTGDGADQLFCGANIYDTMYKIQKYSIFNPFHIRFKSRIKNKYMFYLFGNIPSKYKAQSDIIYLEKGLDGLFKDDGIKRFKQESSIKTKNLQEKRMILDLDTFMPQRVFTKMCVAANKNNINILSPYLTKEIIEYSFTIPHKYKYYKKTKKYILRQVLYKNVPEEIFSKRKKGFDIPAVEWLESSLNKDLNRLSEKNFINNQGIFNYDRVQYIINHISEYPNIVWDYYMFQLWYEKNIIK